MGGNAFSSPQIHEVNKVCLSFKEDRRGDPSSIASKIKALTPDDRFRTLNSSERDLLGRNSLLWAISINNADLARTILYDCGLSDVQRQQLLVCSRDIDGFNPFHYTALWCGGKVVRLLTSAVVDQADRVKLTLDASNIKASHVLHILACKDFPSARRHFMKFLTDEDLTQALLAKDSNGLTPIQVSVKASQIRSALSMLSTLPDLEFSQHIGDLPEKYPSETINHSLTKMDDRLLEVCALKIPDDVIMTIKEPNRPLSSSQIQIVYPLFFDFVIPQDQSLTKRNGLIMYCKVERQGAEEEAAVLTSALETARFSTQTHEWTRFSDMREWMTDKLEELKESTSVLFVAIMAHGFSGNVKGEDGSYGEITHIIDSARKQLPENIPIIFLVQACQNPINSGIQSDQHVLENESSSGNPSTEYPSDATIQQEELVGEPDASKVADTDSNHIELPAKNCALLCATVNGKKAFRCMFPSAFSEELCKADGKTNIFTMFTRASDILANKELEQLRNQDPEFRSTLKKTLYL